MGVFKKTFFVGVFFSASYYGIAAIGEGCYELMTNYEAMMQFSKEELAAFLAHEAFRLQKPISDITKWGISEEFLYLLRLCWLESEVTE